MSRFFVNKSSISGDSIEITGDDVVHIKKVLRLRPEDIITVCNGEGEDYTVKIEKIEEKLVKTRIIEKYSTGTEPHVKAALFQGIPKSDKMDFIIQKAVELGINKIVPVITKHTVVKINSAKDSENKRVRWQRIAAEAAKQCNRGIIPEVGYPVTFDEAIVMVEEYDISIIPFEKESSNCIKDTLAPKMQKTSAAIFIGPEGGFSEDEIQKAVKANIIPVTLGPRILRTETAGIVAISIIMHELGCLC